MRYAEGTAVSVERTKAELEKLLVRYRATEFATGWATGTAQVGFVIADRRIRFILPLPNKADKEFKLTPAGRYERTPEQREKAWEQACRARWRALLLVIKAKLEAATCGISTIEDEFLAWIVVGDGRTVGDVIRPMVAASINSGRPLMQLAERT